MNSFKLLAEMFLIAAYASLYWKLFRSSDSSKGSISLNLSRHIIISLVG
jgi:hypothetical protein